MNVDNIKVVANNSRNAFPLEQQIIDSSKPGICQVVYTRHTLPDSVYKIDVGSIMETTTLNTNAFVRGSQNIEFFFVPYTQIYGDFLQLYSGKGEHVRVPNLNQLRGQQYLPHMKFGEYIFNLFVLWLNGRTIGNYDSDPVIINWTPAQLQSVEERALNIFGRPIISDALRLLDACGYGNLEVVFQSAKELVDSQFESPDSAWRREQAEQFASDPMKAAELLSEFNLALPTYIENYDKVSTVRFDDYLGVLAGWSFVGQQPGDKTWVVLHKSFSVVPLAAYHKIWNDYYRNKIYDDKVDYQTFFNFDFCAYQLDSDLGSISPDYFWRLITPRFHQWKKDLFTGNFASAQFGDVAFQQVSQGSLSFTDSELESSNVTVNDAGNLISSSGNVSKDDPTRFNFNGVGISATDIRYTMALQRYRERLLRTGNRLKDIQKGIFGDSSRFIMDEYSVMLGAFRGSFEINKVAATTETSSVDIGQLGAYGTGSLTGKEITFNCHDHGIIVGIYYFLPETEYNSVMIDPFNTKLQSDDFFKPDFENLGLSPIFGYELEGALGNKVLGYGARYHEYKTSVDLVRGMFSSFHKTTDLQDRYLYEQHVYGPFSDYAAPRDLSLMRENDLSRFYIDPECLNSIFKVAVNSQFRDTDPFKLAMYFNVRAVQPMSVTGLPQL